MLPGWPTIERLDDPQGTHRSPSLQGHFDATVVALWVDHASLCRTLPPELATNGGRYADKHPLLLMVGVQRDVHPVAFGYRFHFPATRSYQEACVIVPDVRYRSEQVASVATDSTYFARLYLDRVVPTYYGRWPWGWNKCLASFRTSEHAVRIERRRKGVLLELVTEPHFSDAAAGETQEWNQIAGWLNQPAIIGRRVVHRPRRLRFDWSASDRYPVQVSLNLGAQLLIGVEPQSRRSDGCGEARCHAFRLSAPWCLHALPEGEAAQDVAA